MFSCIIVKQVSEGIIESQSCSVSGIDLYQFSRVRQALIVPSLQGV